MTETLKGEAELLAQFADNQTQSITEQMIRDFVYSVMGVGAGEADTGTTPTVRTIEVGKGLTQLGNRRFQVDPGADGIYRFEAEGQADIDIQANVNIAILKNDIQSGEGAPDFVLKRTMVPGAKNQASNYIHFFEYHRCVAGDIIELQFQEGGGANVSDVDYVFIGHRIG